MAKRKKEVAEKATTDVAVINMEEDAGAGVESFTQDDLAIPFLQILQKGSPQIDEDHPDHAQWEHLGAKIGQFFNTVNLELADDVMLIPCGYLACFVEWKDRATGGGGWVGQHPIDSALIETCKRNDKNQDVLPNGNIMMLTHYHYCLIVNETAYTPVVISMTSTQLKKSRRWNSNLSTMRVEGQNGSFTPPIFSHLWGLSTVAESNDKGNWRGFRVELIGPVQDINAYAAAKEFFKIVESGAARMSVPNDERGSSSESNQQDY